MIRRVLSAVGWFLAGVVIRSELQRRLEKVSPEAGQKLRAALREQAETYDSSDDHQGPE